MDSDDSGIGGEDTGDHSPLEGPRSQLPFGRSMDAPFLFAAIILTLLIAALIFSYFI